MRTTLTLDSDVAAHLERLRVARGVSYKTLVNDALREGLNRLERGRGGRPGPFTRPRSLGGSRLPDVDDVSEALAVAEGEQHR